MNLANALKTSSVFSFLSDVMSPPPPPPVEDFYQSPSSLPMPAPPEDMYQSPSTVPIPPPQGVGGGPDEYIEKGNSEKL